MFNSSATREMVSVEISSYLLMIAVTFSVGSCLYFIKQKRANGVWVCVTVALATVCHCYGNHNFQLLRVEDCKYQHHNEHGTQSGSSNI